MKSISNYKRSIGRITTSKTLVSISRIKKERNSGLKSYKNSIQYNSSGESNGGILVL